jgi:hypothetical protein
MAIKARRLPVTPAWCADMRPGHWYPISGDAPGLGLPPTAVGTRYAEDNDPARDPRLNPPRTIVERARRIAGRRWKAPWGGRVGFPAITECWNGAVFASRCGASGAMLLFGGGHNDYFGSDVHAFDIASREWRRLTTGYVAGCERDYGAGAVYPDSCYPDGSPLPPHTYHYVQYDPVGNDLLLLKGQTELGPGVRAAAIPHLFNAATRTWRRGPQHADAILNSGGCSAWDAGRRVLWGHAGDDGGGNAFVGYSPDGDNGDGTVGCWRAFEPQKLAGEANHNAMTMLPDADLLVVAVHARNALVTIDPSRPAAGAGAVTSRGAQPRLREHAALEYAAGLGSLVYCAAGDEGRVFEVAWDGTASWRCLTAAGSTDPFALAAAETRHIVSRHHTYGRFRVAHFDGVDLALLVRHVDSAVFAMRLAG